jgi:hypothetical protein
VSFSVEEAEALEGLVEETLRAGTVAGEGKGFAHQGEGVVGVGAEGFDFGLGEEAKLEDGGGEIEAEVLFGGVLGEDVEAEVVEELGELGVVGGRRDLGVRGAEAGAAIVLGGAGFAFWSAGAGGTAGVGTVGQDLGNSCHRGTPSTFRITGGTKR